MSRIPLLYDYETAKKYHVLAQAKNLPQKLGIVSSFRSSGFKSRIGLQLGCQIQ
jgi:hypothetical protein